MRKEPAEDTRYLKRSGEVTDLFRTRLDEVLEHYQKVARFWAPKRGKPLSDYEIREAHVVGSLLRGVDNSDFDLLLIASKIDQEDYKFIKLYLSEMLFNNLQKVSAADVYVRPYDEFPDRPSFEVTDQVSDTFDDFNRRLLESH